MELTEFRSRYEAAAADGIGIYGISVDSVFSHQAFVKELGGLPYELIADFERKMVTDYGVRRDDEKQIAGYLQPLLSRCQPGRRLVPLPLIHCRFG